MVAATSTARERAGVAVLLAAGIVATSMTALVFEALTDRDWSITDWEWPEVLAIALVFTLAAFWTFSVVASRARAPDATPARGRGSVAGRSVGADARSPSLDDDGLVPVQVGEQEGPVERRRRLAPRRVAGAAYRRVPRAPFRLLMPTWLWRGTFRFWLSVLAAHPDPRRGVRELLISYDDSYRAVDQAAIRYDDGVHVKHRLTHYHDFFVERVNPGERVLDIGSGKGEVAFDLVTTAGATVVGVDHDPGHLAFARGRFRHSRLQFVEADVLEWIPEGHFDVVVLSNVFEHLEGRVAFLDGLLASARPDRLLFRVPVYERDWTVPLRAEVGLLAYWDSDHAIEYTPETFTVELSDAGLEVTELVLRWGEIWAVARPLGR